MFNISMKWLFLAFLLHFLFGCGDVYDDEALSEKELVISGLTVTTTASTATIKWKTDNDATNIVEYGQGGVFTSSTLQSTTATTSHSVSLTGLSPVTTYNYRVKNFNETLPDTVSASQSFVTTDETHPTLSQKLNGIWMVGGLSSGGATALLAHATTVAALDLYDPESNTWYANVASAATGTYTPVSFAGTVSYKVSASDHRIYVFGGFDAAGNTKNTVQYYSIEGNSWTTDAANALTQYRAHIHAARVADKIYVMGGVGSGVASTIATAWTGTTTTYEYTPTSATVAWASKNPFTAVATAISERYMLVFNDVIYNMCGRSAAAAVGSVVPDGFVYTANAVTSGTEVIMTTAPSVNRTGVTGDMYVPSLGPAMMILIGGYTVLTGNTGYSVLFGTTASTATSTIQYLHYPFTAPSVWLPATPANNAFPAAVGFGSAVVYYSTALTPNYRFYHFGGTQSVVPAAANGWDAVYWTGMPPLSPSTIWSNTWTTGTDMPSGRYAHTAVLIQQ